VPAWQAALWQLLAEERFLGLRAAERQYRQ